MTAQNTRQAQKTPLLGDLDGWRRPCGVVRGLGVILRGLLSLVAAPPDYLLPDLTHSLAHVPW